MIRFSSEAAYFLLVSQHAEGRTLIRDRALISLKKQANVQKKSLIFI